VLVDEEPGGGGGEGARGARLAEAKALQVRGRENTLRVLRDLHESCAEHIPTSCPTACSAGRRAHADIEIQPCARRARRRSSSRSRSCWMTSTGASLAARRCLPRLLLYLYFTSCRQVRCAPLDDVLEHVARGAKVPPVCYPSVRPATSAASCCQTACSVRIPRQDILLTFMPEAARLCMVLRGSLRADHPRSECVRSSASCVQVPDYGNLTDWALAQAQARARASGAGGRGADRGPGDAMYEARVEVDLTGAPAPSLALLHC
jgi:hypothetical protein